MSRFIALSGVGLTGAGVFGLAGSGILWNFQGRTVGLPTTIISLLVLAIGVVALSYRRKPQTPGLDLPTSPSIEGVSNESSDTNTLTISGLDPVIQELIPADSANINYAPEALQPINVLQSRKRRPGASFKNFRNMANELFRS